MYLHKQIFLINKYKKGANNQAKYWQNDGNPNYVTSSDPLELVVDNTRHL